MAFASRYINAAERQEKGGCVLSIAKVKHLFRIFVCLYREILMFSRVKEGLSEKWWTFFRFSSCFVCNLTSFLRNRVRSYLCCS